MAPSQLQKGEKKPPAKSCNILKTKQNKRQHPLAPTSHPNPYVACSFERFGFKEPQSNGHEKAREGQPMQKDTQSSGRETVERDMGQRDTSRERESTECDSGHQKDRQDMDDDREFPHSSHERDGSDDDNDDNADRNFDSNTQIDRDVGRYTHQRMDNDTGDPDDELADSEQDKVYDVLEHHHAKNRQRKAPSPTHLLKGKGYEYVRTFNRSESPQQRPSQHVRSKSSYPCSPQRIKPLKSSRRYASSGAVQTVQRWSPARHSRRSSRSKSPRRQQSSQQVKYACASSSRTHSPLRRSSRPVTSSSCSRTQPTSRGCSPSHSPSGSTLVPKCECSCSTIPEDARRSGSNKWKAKTNQENPSKLGFYPPTWQVFLQTAKLEMHLQAILAHPIPESQDALGLA
ncbi:uncharacterized protein F5891DRAFT_1194329 [Suillus fuscotomentosus]|uniref:Uncharacterized protein n=1 Tax=Suillus fuscotomentosus TaxID=1912939 RepID=A0AAD4HGF0_9AGAM|nr:uncharacterized protein F5891DRAFT_1194329 [Suillus fuscotomentosus]KAG1895271.1 hypothetical protein F5891DRAFT_1194329 [Suillus fuscotomentosus]